MIVSYKFKGNVMKFYLERHSDFSAFYQVAVQKSYLHLFSIISSGNTVIDAGANIGIFTVIASYLAGKNGKVISIEPDPENLRILKRNIELNKLNNVIVIPKALYSMSGQQLNFHQDGVMSKIMDVNYIGNKITVESITLDDLNKELNSHPTILKMDIEGAERFALLGMKESIQYIKYIEAEIHSKIDYDTLMKFKNNYKFIEEPVENLHSVIKYSFSHPVKILNLEYHQEFKTTKRILRQLLVKQKEILDFPKIIYGVKKCE